MPSPRTSRSAWVLPAVAIAVVLVSLTSPDSSAAGETPPVLPARPIVSKAGPVANTDPVAKAGPGLAFGTTLGVFPGDLQAATGLLADWPRRQAPPSRPVALVPLYVSYAVLNGLDGHSTLRAIDGGASEGNPLMAPFARHPAAMAAVKAGMVAATILGVERLRKKHPVAAVVFMAAATSLYAVVAAHNYRLAHRLGR